MNIKQKQPIDDIMDKIIEFEKVLASLQIIVDSKDVDSDEKHRGNSYMKITQKELKPEKLWQI